MAPKNDPTFLSYILIVMSMFVLLFFTYPQFQGVIAAVDTNEAQQQEIDNKRKTLSQLNEINNSLSKGEGEAQKSKSFSREVVEVEILKYLHDYARQARQVGANIIFQSITVSEPSTSDLGFQKTDVQVQATMSNEQVLFDFIDFLIDPSSEYRFFISNITYPMNDIQGNLQIQIPLTIYHQ